MKKESSAFITDNKQFMKTISNDLKSVKEDIPREMKETFQTAQTIKIIAPKDLQREFSKQKIKAGKIIATWCGQYTNMKTYFEEEKKFLEEHREKNQVIIRRLINPLTIPYDDLLIHEKYIEDLQNSELKKLYEYRFTGSIRNYEYLVSTNDKKEKTAIFSILSNLSPNFGIKLEPNKEKQLGDEVKTLENGFELIFESDKQSHACSNDEEIWDGLAKKYDEQILANKNDAFNEYLEQEREYKRIM